MRFVLLLDGQNSRLIAFPECLIDELLPGFSFADHSRRALRLRLQFRFSFRSDLFFDFFPQLSGAFPVHEDGALSARSVGSGRSEAHQAVCLTLQTLGCYQFSFPCFADPFGLFFFRFCSFEHISGHRAFERHGVGIDTQAFRFTEMGIGAGSALEGFGLFQHGIDIQLSLADLLDLDFGGFQPVPEPRPADLPVEVGDAEDVVVLIDAVQRRMCFAQMEGDHADEVVDAHIFELRQVNAFLFQHRFGEAEGAELFDALFQLRAV